MMNYANRYEVTMKNRGVHNRQLDMKTMNSKIVVHHGRYVKNSFTKHHARQYIDRYERAA